MAPERYSDIEKPGLNGSEIEKANFNEADHDSEASDSRIIAFSPKEQKSIMLRVDCRLVLTLGVLYMISLMDRTNLGAAAIAGYV